MKMYVERDCTDAAKLRLELKRAEDVQTEDEPQLIGILNSIHMEVILLGVEVLFSKLQNKTLHFKRPLEEHLLLTSGAQHVASIPFTAISEQCE